MINNPPTPETTAAVPGDVLEAPNAGPAAVFTQFRILKDIIGYSSSTLVSQAVAMVAGFWVARLLAPADFGIWNAVSLVLLYGAYLDLGASSAMARDLPFHLGRGDTEKAAALDGAARWATLGGAGLAAAVVIVVSFGFSQSPLMQVGLCSMAVVLVLQQAYTYHRTWLRTHNQFAELSRQQFVAAVTTSVLAILGVTLAGLLGRMMAAVVAAAVILMYAIHRDRWRPVPALTAAELWSMTRVGVPITISIAVVALLNTIDRLMVVTLLGPTQLGFFGLALLLGSLISIAPSMVIQVLTPRITYRFGQSGRSIPALRSLVLTPPVVLACLLPLVIGPVYILLPLLITLVLPAYAPAITATRIVVVGIFFYVLGMTDQFLVNVGKLKALASFAAMALALNIALDYFAVRLGYGIEGVAFSGTGLTFFIYSTIVIGYVLSHYTRDVRDWCRYFARLWLPFIYMLVLLGITDVIVRQWGPGSTPAGLMAAAGAQIALYLAGTPPLVILAARAMNLNLSRSSVSRAVSGH